MFFASHFKKRFTERSLDLIWQRVPDFGKSYIWNTFEEAIEIKTQTFFPWRYYKSMIKTKLSYFLIALEIPKATQQRDLQAIIC